MPTVARTPPANSRRRRCFGVAITAPSRRPGDGRDAGGPQRRDQRGERGESGAEDEADDDRPRLDHGPGCGQVDAQRLEQRP